MANTDILEAIAAAIGMNPADLLGMFPMDIRHKLHEALDNGTISRAEYSRLVQDVASLPMPSPVNAANRPTTRQSQPELSTWANYDTEAHKIKSRKGMPTTSEMSESQLEEFSLRLPGYFQT